MTDGIDKIVLVNKRQHLENESKVFTLRKWVMTRVTIEEKT